MSLESLVALKSGVGDLTYLFRVKILPLFAMESEIEGQDILSINEVQKGVANVTFVLEINRKIEKVKQILVSDLNSLNQHLARILIGDVLDHDACSAIKDDVLWDNSELLNFIFGVIAILDAELFDTARNEDLVVFLEFGFLGYRDVV